MRSEKEMFDLIIRTAEEDERIRAAYLGGSRVNPNVPRDIFQDYDVVYIVEETGSFRKDRSWIDRFGERLYMQYPEDSPFFPSDPENCYGWLIQFADGNRLDLHVCTLKSELKNLETDHMYRVLMDKDGCLPVLEHPSDCDFWVRRPDREQFLSCCNEFWWCLNNVAKGLWREEILYVMEMLNYVREELLRLLEWKVGAENGFAVSVGKAGKYLDKWIPQSLWKRYLATFPLADTERAWIAVFNMCDLLDELGKELGTVFGYPYNSTEAENSRGYLEHVRRLPKDAREVYPASAHCPSD